ncbi:hypothetical protein, partial [Stenotrophomonas maltophilia]|uniref:hypothetical protein n=1 Tax=Stenotrophomonas maltophilia TaxID=40324 RepID=UPI001C8C4841
GAGWVVYFFYIIFFLLVFKKTNQKTVFNSALFSVWFSRGVGGKTPQGLSMHGCTVERRQ